jgi:hypothetical protein
LFEPNKLIYRFCATSAGFRPISPLQRLYRLAAEKEAQKLAPMKSAALTL